jgi:stage II sporulation protein D
VRVRVGGQVRPVPLEEYVLASALSEVSPIDETPSTILRIFEVQAVLARTYAAANIGRHRAEGFDLCDDTHCQLYEPGRVGPSRFTAAAKAATIATKGVVLVHDGRPVQALFHADCGGHTADAHDVWGGARLVYLRARSDEQSGAQHRQWTFERPLEAVRTALNGDQRAEVGRHLSAVHVIERDTSGRAMTLELRGERVRRVSGETFRAVLGRVFGPRAVQSTRFTVSIDAGRLQLAGRGFGHGVGLCQAGAAARARRGAAAAAILAAYFPGALLSTPR